MSRDGGWIRRAIREGRLPATRDGRAYLLRRRDIERLDRTAPRRRPLTVVASDEPDGDEAIGEGPESVGPDAAVDPVAR